MSDVGGSHQRTLTDAVEASAVASMEAVPMAGGGSTVESGAGMATALAPMPPLLYFFGLPGSGKSHCGALAARELGYAYHDGDAWLPDDLRASLGRGEGFTPEQRDRYAEAIAARITEAGAAEANRGQPRPLAVAQATFKRRHRDVIRGAHPAAVFVWVRAGESTRLARLGAGGNLVDPELGRRMARDFEPPAGDEVAVVRVIDNDAGTNDDGLLQQLRAIVGRRDACRA